MINVTRIRAMKKINKIMCCCGNGVGTSLLMQMTIEEALSILDLTDIEVSFGPISEISLGKADLYVISEEYSDGLQDYPILALENLADAEIAATLLRDILEEG